MSRITKRTVRGLLAAAAIALAAASGLALVNPNFTVVDLKSASSEILVGRVDSVTDSQITVAVSKTLAGKQADADKQRKIILKPSGSEATAKDIQNAIRASGSHLAMLFVRKEPNEDGDVVASLQVGTKWFGLIRTGEDRWDLVADPDDLETVWAGSASQLLRAVEYVLSDRSAEFPVESGLTWIDSEDLGELKGDAHGMLATEDGVIVLSEGGDRIYRTGSGNQGPKDVTDRLGLTSKSRAMTGGDFNGDGLADLASWDGGRLRLVLRAKDGTFSDPTAGSELKQCHSLASLGGSLVAAGSDGVAIAAPDGDDGLTIRRLPGPPKEARLGDGGAAVVADFNDDGRADILHVYPAGLVFYAGGEGEQRFAEPVVQKVSVVKAPAAAICGDYDGDGRLDVFVAGQGGAIMLSRDGKGQWKNVTYQTGELDAAVGVDRTQTSAVGACPADLRGDGRQSVAVFSRDAAPGLFYARGFGCFAIAISLTRSQEDNDGYDALSRGQQAGLVVDLNGDRAPDLLGVDLDRNVWAVLTEPDRLRRFAVTVGVRAESEPVTLRAAMGSRGLGMYVVRPGCPQTIVLPRAGKLTLSWKSADAKKRSREVVVTRPVTIEHLTEEKQ